jgi:YesN/AraC family two-component response regulator
MLFDSDNNIILKNLDAMLKTYFMSTGVSIAAINQQGEITLHYGGGFAFCAKYKKFSGSYCDCAQTYVNAFQNAINIGEPYFFFCRNDFLHIAIPLLSNKKFLGGIIVGPIVIQSLDENFDRRDFWESLKTEGQEKFDKMLEEYNKISVIDPIRANYLGNMLFAMASKEMENYNTVMAEKQKKMYQLSLINENMQLFKTDEKNHENLHNLEQQLYSKAKNGNFKEAKNELNVLLAFIYIKEGSNINAIRVRVMEICSLLSRAVIEGGGNEKEILAFNYTLFNDLNKLKSFDDISYWMSKILDYYLEQVIDVVNVKNKDVIKKAIHYINNHFRDDLKTETVANLVFLNTSYFSTLFKQERGLGFAEYVQHVRVEESKLMLTNSNTPILDIAIANGFNSQSYYTKVFKKYTGHTPKQYRLLFS